MASETINPILTSHVIVITGASSGFGKGIALECARAGAAVVLAARREHLLDEISSECEAAGGRALAVPTDVGNADDVERLAHEAITTFQRIDVWINDAGVGAAGRFHEVPLVEHVKVIETNLLGTLYGSYYAMRQFRKQQSGTLINIASVLGKLPSPYYASYAASKHGVVGLGSTLRHELAEDSMDKIHVCTVMPTSMDAPFFDHVAHYASHESPILPPHYDPQDVVDTVVDLIARPRDEVTVGAAGKFMAFSQSVAPTLTEPAVGRASHREHAEEAPPEDKTRGNYFVSPGDETGVHGRRLKD